MSDRAAAWARLHALREDAGSRRMADLFDADPRRADRFSRESVGLRLDFSRTSIDDAILEALLGLSAASGVEARRDAMFAGERVNATENRAALHVALRGGAEQPGGAGAEIAAEVAATLGRMRDFAHAVRDGSIAGQGGAYRDVVNIGIGGSDLGPAMAARALSPFCDGPRLHFVSNIDGADIADTLAGLDPARTLVIVASKSFTTLETMTNAATARRWMAAALPDPMRQFVALSSAVEKVDAWFIPPERRFGFADWVGGRLSVWGPIGLSLMIGIGPQRFDDFLAGARAMDRHFQTAPPTENLPVLLALVGIWHRQICGYPARAVLPYAQRLARLPAYLQQLEMESNGKSVRLDGSPLDRPCGPLVWGEPGTNGQHAFHQWLHQGTDIIPAEFILVARGEDGELDHQHRMLLANGLAQAEALMRGRDADATRRELAGTGLTGAALEAAVPHRVFPGERPSTTLIAPRLDPFRLGQILALYEHRVFVEGAVLGINSFDQWGVELGKQLAHSVAPLLDDGDEPGCHDPATRAAAEALRRMRAAGEDDR